MAARPTSGFSPPPRERSWCLTSISFCDKEWVELCLHPPAPHVVQSDSSNFTCFGASEAQHLLPTDENLHCHFQSPPEKIYISADSQSSTFAGRRENNYVYFQSCLGMKKEMLSETSVFLKTEAAGSSETLAKSYTVSQSKIRLLPNILLHFEDHLLSFHVPPCRCGYILRTPNYHLPSLSAEKK